MTCESCLDVDAARGDVGRDEDVVAPVLEAVQRLRRAVPASVAVDALARDARASETLGDAVGAVLGAREDEDVSSLRASSSSSSSAVFRFCGDGVDRLRDRRARGVPLRSTWIGDRVASASRAASCATRRGIVAEKSSVCRLRRQRGEDPADVRQEAHVEHAVGLVEHEDLEVVEPRSGCCEVVEQPARAWRRGCRRPRAAPCSCGPIADAAEDGDGATGGVWTVSAFAVLLDLRGELAGRREDERARAPRFLPSAAGGSGAGRPPSFRCRSWHRRARRALPWPAEWRRSGSAWGE